MKSHSSFSFLWKVLSWADLILCVNLVLAQELQSERGTKLHCNVYSDTMVWRAKTVFLSQFLGMILHQKFLFVLLKISQQISGVLVLEGEVNWTHITLSDHTSMVLIFYSLTLYFYIYSILSIYNINSTEVYSLQLLLLSSLIVHNPKICLSIYLHSNPLKIYQKQKNAY